MLLVFCVSLRDFSKVMVLFMILVWLVMVWYYLYCRLCCFWIVRIIDFSIVSLVKSVLIWKVCVMLCLMCLCWVKVVIFLLLNYILFLLGVKLFVSRLMKVVLLVLLGLIKVWCVLGVKVSEILLLVMKLF